MRIGLPLIAALALSITPSVSRAEMTVPELQQLIGDLEHLTPSEEPDCEPAAAEKSQIFAFEGAGGYCPRYSYMNLRYSPEGKSLADRLAETPETYENVPFLKKIRAELESETDSHNCYLARNLHTQLEKLPPAERIHRQVRYYSKDGDSEAATCVIHSLDPAVRLRVIGFSMGGYATVQFARALNEHARAIDHVVTLDPVGKNVLFVSGVFFTLDSPFMKRTPNAARWTNYFQKYDWKSIYDHPYFQLGARGSRVSHADVNYEILRGDYRTQWEVEHPHLAINLTAPVQRTLEEVFR